MPKESNVLIATATKVESLAVLERFVPGEQHKPLEIKDRTYFDLGSHNGSHVYLTQCEMGSASLGATLQAVTKAIGAFAPKTVIMVGIAFGVNEKKQAIGTVLVSKHLCLYDLQRVGTTIGRRGKSERQIVLRGARPDCSARLLNQFRSAELSWDNAAVSFGTILTGEKLVDNQDFSNQLQGFETEAIGGEMEGAGLYVACQDAKVDWILVKGICDWADGKKAEDKAARQNLAAKNAVDFVFHALTFSEVQQRRDAAQTTRHVLSCLKMILAREIDLVVHNAGLRISATISRDQLNGLYVPRYVKDDMSFLGHSADALAVDEEGWSSPVFPEVGIPHEASGMEDWMQLSARISEKRHAVLGGPGSGKTFLFWQRLLTMNQEAQRLLASQERSPGIAPSLDKMIEAFTFAVYLRASEIGRYKSFDKSGQQAVVDLLRDRHPAAVIAPKATLAYEQTFKYLHHAVDAGKCLVLVDAFDEVSDEEGRHAVKQVVRSLDWVHLSSRPTDFAPDEFGIDKIVVLQSYGVSELLQAIGNWFAVFPSQTKQAENSLRQHLQSHPAILRLMKLPVILRFACQLASENKIDYRSWKSRTDVYDNFVNKVFQDARSSESERFTRLEPTTVRRCLADLARELFQLDPGRQEWPFGDANRIFLDDCLVPEWPRLAQVLMTRQDAEPSLRDFFRIGILIPQSLTKGEELVHFNLRSIGEFLMAEGIKNSIERLTASGNLSANDAYLSHLDRLAWHPQAMEVFVFLSGLLARSLSQKALDFIDLRRLLEMLHRPAIYRVEGLTDLGHYRSALALRCAAEAKRNLPADCA